MLANVYKITPLIYFLFYIEYKNKIGTNAE